MLGLESGYFFVLNPCTKITILYNRVFRQINRQKTALKDISNLELSKNANPAVIPIVLNQG